MTYISNAIVSDSNKRYSNNLLKTHFGLSNLMSLNINSIFDEHVKSGVLSNISESNHQFVHFFYKDELKRRININTILLDSDLQIADNFHFYHDNNGYECEEFITPFQIDQYDSIPSLSDDVLKKIMKYCEEEEITHIYNIGQYREGVIVDSSNNTIYGEFIPPHKSEYSAFGLDKKLYTNYNKYNFDIEVDDKAMCCESDYAENKPDNIYKKGYVFNKSYYTIIGAKTINNDVLTEWQKCTSSLEYFNKKYIKNKKNI